MNHFRQKKGALTFVLILMLLTIVVHVRGEKDPPVELTLLQFSADQVDWMEISPKMSLTTYVDDDFMLEKTLELLTQVELRPATQEEITQLKKTQPDPPEMTIDGNSYNRNILIEFVQKKSESTEVLCAVQLCGDLIRINGNYFVSSASASSSSLTDNFITILNEIHNQDKGKSSERSTKNGSVNKVV